MKTDRLSSTLRKELNQQMTMEGESSQIYLMLSGWADSEGYMGISKFLFGHAKEEREHMDKFFAYILERGSKAKIETIAAPGKEPKSVEDCFEMVYKQEVAVTEAIHKIVKMAMEEGDWATWDFLQEFVKEQREEERLAMNLLDEIKIAGGKSATPSALYDLDKSISKQSQDPSLAEDVEDIS